jgi:hypothetical protein
LKAVKTVVSEQFGKCYSELVELPVSFFIPCLFALGVPEG